MKSPPLTFGPEWLQCDQALRKHYATAKLKLTSLRQQVASSHPRPHGAFERGTLFIARAMSAFARDG